MRCENIFCVYWCEGKCTLDEISLNAYGACECCVYIDLSERTLKRKRKEYFDKHFEESE